MQQQLSTGCRPLDTACSLEWGSASLNSDMLIRNHVSEILMDEAVNDADDATNVQHTGGTSNYQAIFSSLQDILADSATDDQLHKTRGLSPAEGALPHSQSHLQQVDGTSNHQANMCSSFLDLIADSATDDQLHNSIEASLLRDEFLPDSGHPQGSPSKSTKIILDLHQNKNSGRHSLCPYSNFKKDTAAQNHSLGGVLLTDATVPCLGKDHAVVEGQLGQAHDGSGMSKAPSAHEEFSLKVAELDLSFEDLKLDDVYSSIYVAERGSSTITATSGKHNAGKRKSVAPRKARLSTKPTSKVPVFVDVKEVLMSCAQAVATGDVQGANWILQDLHRVYGASAHGNGLQRMAYIFSKALTARMRGTGAQEFEAMVRDMPSSAAHLKAAKFDLEVTPNQKVVHYLANESILKAAEGASRLHIVDYGITNGLQWPCLINALADRKEGPPLLVITGIEFPQLGVDTAERLAESGRRLAAYAKSHSVPFQFSGIVSDKWEDLDAASLLPSKAEVLVVNCGKCLSQLSDDSTNWESPISQRQKLFSSVHSLNPHLLVTVFINATLDSPFFVTRFRETMDFYSNVFDMLETLWADTTERHIIENSYFYRNIINIVACEGVDRIIRDESYKKWHARISKAGFEQLLIPATIAGRSVSHVKQHYHKDFLMHDDGDGCMLLGWKGRSVFAMSAWRPCRVC